MRNNNQNNDEASNPFDGSSMFSKKFLIFSAILIAIMLFLAIFVNPDGFREQVNNATFPWDFEKDTTEVKR